MDKDFGAPHLDDATAEFDRMVNDAGKWMMQTVREMGPQILNRPIGSVPVKPKDQSADYQMVRGDPAKLAQMHAERMQQRGQKQGTIDFIRWVRANERRLTNASDR